jgi:hypothetical protein
MRCQRLLRHLRAFFSLSKTFISFWHFSPRLPLHTYTALKIECVHRCTPSILIIRPLRTIKESLILSKSIETVFISMSFGTKKEMETILRKVQSMDCVNPSSMRITNRWGKNTHLSSKINSTKFELKASKFSQRYVGWFQAPWHVVDSMLFDLSEYSCKHGSISFWKLQSLFYGNVIRIGSRRKQVILDSFRSWLQSRRRIRRKNTQNHFVFSLRGSTIYTVETTV